MIKTTLTRKTKEEKRIEHRSSVSTLTNIITNGTNCSSFEAQIITTKAEEVFGIGEYSEDAELQPGQMIWKAIDENEPPGKPLLSCIFLRIRLTVHRVEEDREARAFGGGLRAKRQQQITRMCVEAMDQGALLTQEDLAVILDCDVKTIRKDILDYQKKHGVLIPTRGTKKDIGPGITHRDKVIERFIRGEEVISIARDLNHSIKAVERYITMFCRIIYTQQQVHNSLKTAMIVGRTVALVTKYLTLRDEWMNTTEYRERLEQIKERGLLFWDAQDGKKRDSQKNGRLQ